MDSSSYDFQTQLRIGRQYEQAIRKYFEEAWGWRFLAASKGGQQRGIDYFVTNLDGLVFSVEIKADFVAGRTGNIFVETWSNVATKKRGWAFTSCAQILLYGVPEMNVLYKVEMLAFKYALSEWSMLYPEKEVQNNGWIARGLLVPIDSLFDLNCTEVFEDIDFILTELEE